jgi:hypothetical protein
VWRFLPPRLEFHYTPKRGSWLNVAECKLAVLASQCLARRLANIDTVRREIAAREYQRNLERPTVKWHFTVAQARRKLQFLYPERELAELGREQDTATLADNDLERELARWLSTTREPNAAAGYRAGWARLNRLICPRAREWESLWWQAMREQSRLRGRVGVLLREVSRLSDRG